LIKLFSLIAWRFLTLTLVHNRIYKRYIQESNRR